LYIEEEQTTQWPREKLQKDKQRSTKHTHKAKDRVTRPQLTPQMDVHFALKYGKQFILTQLTINRHRTKIKKTPTAQHRQLNR
jgi:hypothetical protein